MYYLSICIIDSYICLFVCVSNIVFFCFAGDDDMTPGASIATYYAEVVVYMYVRVCVSWAIYSRISEGGGAIYNRTSIYI